MRARNLSRSVLLRLSLALGLVASLSWLLVATPAAPAAPLARESYLIRNATQEVGVGGEASPSREAGTDQPLITQSLSTIVGPRGHFEFSAQQGPTGVVKSVTAVENTPPSGPTPSVAPGQTVSFRIDVSNLQVASTVRDFLGPNFTIVDFTGCQIVPTPATRPAGVAANATTLDCPVSGTGPFGGGSDVIQLTARLNQGVGPGLDPNANVACVQTTAAGDFTTCSTVQVNVVRPSTVGVYRPNISTFFLRNQNTEGVADHQVTFGIPGDQPVVGDWTAKGFDSLGVFRDGRFFLRNSNTQGFADIDVTFGLPGDEPVAGDWTGKGFDSIGVYRPSNSTFYLRNSNTSGFADITVTFGLPGDIPVVGDWNGDGVDTVGVYRPSTGQFFLRNSNTTGVADLTITYGQSGDVPVVGDWNGDGIDTIGIRRGGLFFLRNSNTTGFADLTFTFGVPGDEPIAGHWGILPPPTQAGPTGTSR